MIVVKGEAQSETKKHSVLVYPTRLANRYFPAFSLGYLYHSDNRWAAGVSVGALAQGGYLGKNFLKEKAKSIHGYDLGLEARWSLDRYKPISIYAALEGSRAYTKSRYGITGPDASGVGKLVNARIVARRSEFNVGFNKNWGFDFGLVIDMRIGIGLAGHSWSLTNKNLTPAPDATIYDADFDEEGFLGLKQKANDVTFFPTARFRLGVGWKL